MSFIPHITSLRSRCTKLLDLIKVLSNTTWGADRKVLLHLNRALILSKLNYGCIVYGSARPSYIKRLDTVHNQGLRLCLGAFRTSPVQSLYVETKEPPLGMRRPRLSLQYCVKLMSNEVNPAYSAVFQSDIVATYEAKERTRACRKTASRLGHVVKLRPDHCMSLNCVPYRACLKTASQLGHVVNLRPG